LVLIHIVPPVLLSFVPEASSGPATEKYHLISFGEITHNIYLLVNIQINKMLPGLRNPMSETIY
jgi:hypothetical protein